LEEANENWFAGRELTNQRNVWARFYNAPAALVVKGAQGSVIGYLIRIYLKAGKGKGERAIRDFCAENMDRLPANADAGKLARAARSAINYEVTEKNRRKAVAGCGHKNQIVLSDRAGLKTLRRQAPISPEEGVQMANPSEGFDRRMAEIEDERILRVVNERGFPGVYMGDDTVKQYLNGHAEEILRDTDQLGEFALSLSFDWEDLRNYLVGV